MGQTNYLLKLLKSGDLNGITDFSLWKTNVLELDITCIRSRYGEIPPREGTHHVFAFFHVH